YGGGSEGTPEHGAFRDRLAAADAVVHNQDNREHDLLDSDDYYQFEGGLAVAIRHVSGRQPAIWHNDHSRPETPRIRALDAEMSARLLEAIERGLWRPRLNSAGERLAELARGKAS